MGPVLEGPALGPPVRLLDQGAGDGAMTCVRHQLVRARQHRDGVELHAAEPAQCRRRAAARPGPESPWAKRVTRRASSAEMVAGVDAGHGRPALRAGASDRRRHARARAPRGDGATGAPSATAAASNAGRAGREERTPDAEEGDQRGRGGHADGDGTRRQADEDGAGPARRCAGARCKRRVRAPTSWIPSPMPPIP